ncbi:MAG: hypothetical protein Ctma_0351 [Catillopecten margaritatus gill symbiont]|uniref:Polysaccharide chain length determinant N-terminal domain-containing protein n=1 Tax=Catillopecten margaritatus gill symbiont TaxID=3083288 RepID=A0AAU6PF72_9GAMM
MFRFIEKTFLKIIQIIGLLFATIVLVASVFLGYNKIDIKETDAVVEMPVIKFSDYQKMTLNQEQKIAKNLGDNQQFENAFDEHINGIVGALSVLSDKAVDKEDLKQKVKISSRVKVSQYPQPIQLTYLTSLEKLTKQVATVGAEVDMDKLIQWHDYAFFQQMQKTNQNNFLQIGSVRIQKNAYSALWNALAIFAMLVIMLAVLRIEQNTRKK